MTEDFKILNPKLKDAFRSINQAIDFVYSHNEDDFINNINAFNKSLEIVQEKITHVYY